MRRLAFAATFAGVLAGPAAAGAQVITVGADRLIDVAAGRVVQQPVVLIRDGRITAAGPRSEVKVPADARRIDLPGMIILPGLIAETQRQGFKRARAAGVRMVYGTDAGVYPHGDNGKQFQWMVRYGMTPMQAIQSATLHAAEALGAHGRDIGVLAAGRLGDVIAVAGNPLDDVRLLENVAFVMKGGAVVKDRK
jgi:imidazolonepropionase-like amidohydrolase